MLRSCVRIQKDWCKYDRVTKQNSTYRLAPAHSRADKSRRQHVRRNTVGHRDPQRREIIRAPRTLFRARRRKVFVVEPARMRTHPQKDTVRAYGNTPGSAWGEKVGEQHFDYK